MFLITYDELLKWQSYPANDDVIVDEASVGQVARIVAAAVHVVFKAAVSTENS